MTTSQALYRFYAADDALLYVGVTMDLPGRWKSHRDDKPWWTDVTRCTVEHYPTRAAVLDAERAAIQAEKPRWNVVHNRRRRPDWGWPAAAMPDLCHDHCVVDHDDATAYFPHSWTRGLASYRCRRGHAWTCYWGHNGSGTAALDPVDLMSGGWPAAGLAPCGHSWLEPGTGIPSWCGCQHSAAARDKRVSAGGVV